VRVPLNRQGYYQSPAILGDTLFFLSEGQIWRSCVSQLGQPAYRVTAVEGVVTSFVVSEDGARVFYVSTSEGHQDLYRLCVASGVSVRLSYWGASLEVLNVYQGRVTIRSNHESPFDCLYNLYQVDPETGVATALDVGPGNFISYAKDQTALGRHGYGYVSWKRYRGGTAGEIWVRADGGHWRRLFSDLKSNLLRPLCVGERLYFLSDHDGMGSLYSATFEGEDIKRHTHFDDFYVRDIATDGARIVYHKGGDVWLFDPVTGQNVCISPKVVSGGALRRRRFVDASDNLTAHALSPSGKTLCLTTRGRLMVGSPFKGPMIQLGKRHGVRYRLGAFMDETRVLSICDEGGREDIHIINVETLEVKPLTGDWGRIINLVISPKGGFAVLENHEHKLLTIDLTEGVVDVIDYSAFGVYRGISISADGRFVAYSFARSNKVYEIKIFDVQQKKTYSATTPRLSDICPAFDPKGRYLYFLSAHTYEHDGLRGGDGFSYQPSLLTLSKHAVSPFIAPSDATDSSSQKEEADKEAGDDGVTCMVDADRIVQRVVSFPMDADDYVGVWAVGDKVFFMLDISADDDDTFVGSLLSFDMSLLKEDTFYKDLRDISMARGGEWMSIIDDEKKLRVLRTGEKPEDEDTSFRGGGWFDFQRARFEVDPGEEWRFMFKEAWRLQKDLFWDAKLGDVDWTEVRDRYAPLVDRVNASFELMDVIGEMQGELGVSHAYTWGYDSGKGPDYGGGLLGATFTYEASEQSWVLHDFTPCVPEDEDLRIPLQAPGVNMKRGDRLIAVDGQVLSSGFGPEAALVARANGYVALLVQDAESKAQRSVAVKPRRALRAFHYGAFVKANRDYVHKASTGRVGYIHIPDMSTQGFQEFFKAYVHEFDREALILDTRFNRGGLISSEILSQLLRKRLGYDQSRHEGQVPYMWGSPRGPMVALCNEYTASDGDMFAYSFQRLKLGPLIGRRTWGGVIGIFPRYPLLDGSMTSQPEYAIWFHDIGWRLENEGAEPDILVDIPPGCSPGAGDPQLDRGIQEALALLG
jgi:tricorn protease